LYLVAKALSVVIAVAATNVAAMTATIAIYLKFISGNWRGHSVYLH
jgi:tRNA threonylcarbamoyladenosine modification (KEOPS) complex  Pcc1 subunit